MFENTGSIAAFSWQRIVEEALRRRRDEGLTQKEHSALAGVSHPTMAAFERGDTTLTLAKALDILRVVGLVEEPIEGDGHSSFVIQTYNRWRDLTAPLPPDSPARFPNGFFQMDYWLEGDLRAPPLGAFEGVLQKAVVRKTGWPPFFLPTRDDIRPYEKDGTIECWIAPQSDDVERAFNDPAHCDFWRASPAGSMFLIRGYQEDSNETFPAGTILDTTLPLWRMGEVLLHAEQLASLLKRDPDSTVTIHFRARYTGLTGRVLRPWANPLSEILVEGHAARSDEAVLETSLSSDNVENHLADLLLPLMASLFDRFGISGLSFNRVDAEVQRLLNSRVAKNMQPR